MRFARIAYSAAGAACMLLLLSRNLMAQHSPDQIQVEQNAMHRLSFLIGQWKGPVTVSSGGGEQHLTQTESVVYKLDDVLLLVQGNAKDSQGKTPFQALATIAFDVPSKTYRIRAYAGGNYVDNQLTLLPDGFSWQFTAGPAVIVNTMHLTNGRWQESTETKVGEGPSKPTMTMLLERQR